MADIHAQGFIDNVMSWRGYQRLLYVLAPIVVLFFGIDIYFKGANLPCWNWMFYTGFITFAVMIAVAIISANQLSVTLDALKINNAALLAPDDIDRIYTQIKTRTRTWRLWSAIWVFLLVLLSWLWFAFWNFSQWAEQYGGWGPMFAALGSDRIAIFLGLAAFIVLVMGACGFYAGAFFGTIAGRAGLASFIADARTPLRLRPDHYDGATGMKPVGDLYLVQALLTGVPLLWYSVWWLIIPTYDETVCSFVKYDVWRWPFVFAWLTTLGYTYLGFVRPILKLRQRLKAYKAELMAKEVPEAKAQIDSLQLRLIREPLSDSDRERILDEIDNLSYKIWCIHKMSVWPMDATTRRRYFSLNAGLAVVPAFIEIIASFGALQAYLPGELDWQWFKDVGAMLL